MPKSFYTGEATTPRAEYRSAGASRPAVSVEHEGRLVTLQELADLTGLKYFCLWERHRKGLRGADLAAPARPAGNRRTQPAEPLRLADEARRLSATGMKPRDIAAALNLHIETVLLALRQPEDGHG